MHTLAESNEQIRVTIRVVASNDNRVQLLSTLRPMVGPIRALNGCTDCHIYQDVENLDEVIFCEEWIDEASFAEHVRSKDYLKILEWMELSAQQPDIKMESIKEGQNGMGCIEKYRAAH